MADAAPGRKTRDSADAPAPCHTSGVGWVTRSALVFFGAGVGANARYWLGRWVQSRLGAAFPWGTFAVNASGSLLIGLVLGVILRFEMSQRWQLLLVVGLLGGYTTFSSLSYETCQLLRARAYGWAFANSFGSLAIGVAAAMVGEALARALVGEPA